MREIERTGTRRRGRRRRRPARREARVSMRELAVPGSLTHVDELLLGVVERQVADCEQGESR